jgi:hypothetical protein
LAAQERAWLQDIARVNERKIERLKKNFQDYLEMALNRQVSQFKHWREADYGIAGGPAQYWWQPWSMALKS